MERYAVVTSGPNESLRAYARLRGYDFYDLPLDSPTAFALMADLFAKGTKGLFWCHQSTIILNPDLFIDRLLAAVSADVIVGRDIAGHPSLYHAIFRSSEWTLSFLATMIGLGAEHFVELYHQEPEVRRRVHIGNYWGSQAGSPLVYCPPGTDPQLMNRFTSFHLYRPPLETKATPPPLETKATLPPLETKATPPPLETKATPPPLETKVTPPPVDTKFPVGTKWQWFAQGTRLVGWVEFLEGGKAPTQWGLATWTRLDDKRIQLVHNIYTHIMTWDSPTHMRISRHDGDYATGELIVPPLDILNQMKNATFNNPVAS